MAFSTGPSEGPPLGPHALMGPRHFPLSSSAPPWKPYILFPEPLEAGRPTKLTCTLSLASGEGHPLLFSWVGEAVDIMNPDTLHSSELTLTPRPQDHGTNLTCRVTLQGSQVTLETTVRLNVSCKCGGAAGSLGAVLAGGGWRPCIPFHLRLGE